jgi:hypothetical protein
MRVTSWWRKSTCKSTRVTSWCRPSTWKSTRVTSWWRPSTWKSTRVCRRSKGKHHDVLHGGRDAPVSLLRRFRLGGADGGARANPKIARRRHIRSMKNCGHQGGHHGGRIARVRPTTSRRTRFSVSRQRLDPLVSTPSDGVVAGPALGLDVPRLDPLVPMPPDGIAAGPALGLCRAWARSCIHCLTASWRTRRSASTSRAWIRTCPRRPTASRRTPCSASTYKAWICSCPRR